MPAETVHGLERLAFGLGKEEKSQVKIGAALGTQGRGLCHESVVPLRMRLTQSILDTVGLWLNVSKPSFWIFLKISLPPSQVSLISQDNGHLSLDHRGSPCSKRLRVRFHSSFMRFLKRSLTTPMRRSASE